MCKNFARKDCFESMEVEKNSSDAMETLGTKEKFWFHTFNSDSRESEFSQWLFKYNRSEATGEDWAEIIVAHLSKLLGLPYVDYRLALAVGQEGTKRRGVISENFTQKNEPLSIELMHGNRILKMTKESYNIDAPTHKDYNINTIVRSIKLFGEACANLDVEYLGNNADDTCFFKTFAGYILLDMWVSNQDRHHENWGIILSVNEQTEKKTWSIAPTYDHGSSMAAFESDNKRKSILKNENNFGIMGFVDRAKTPFYSIDKKRKSIKTIEVLKDIYEFFPTEVMFWQNKLEQVQWMEIEKIFTKFPENIISDVAIDFSLNLLEANKKRILGV